MHQAFSSRPSSLHIRALRYICLTFCKMPQRLVKVRLSCRSKALGSMSCQPKSSSLIMASYLKQFQTLYALPDCSRQMRTSRHAGINPVSNSLARVFLSLRTGSGGFSRNPLMGLTVMAGLPVLSLIADSRVGLALRFGLEMLNWFGRSDRTDWILRFMMHFVRARLLPALFAVFWDWLYQMCPQAAWNLRACISRVGIV